jgi:adenylylsulfate kinase-like enzyme
MIILSVGSKSLTGVSPGNFRIEQMLALFVYLGLSLDVVVVLNGDEVRRLLTIENNELTLSRSDRQINIFLI